MNGTPSKWKSAGAGLLAGAIAGIVMTSVMLLLAWISLTSVSGGVPLKGIAFAGDRGVDHVEVSLDDERTWQEARIDYSGTKLTWVLWSFDWKPAGPGE